MFRKALSEKVDAGAEGECFSLLPAGRWGGDGLVRETNARLLLARAGEALLAAVPRVKADAWQERGTTWGLAPSVAP